MITPLLLALTAVLTPPLTRDHWLATDGHWRFAEGTVEQTLTWGLGKTFLRDPAFGDLKLSVDFRIAPTGQGVRAAALMFRATGTMSYYWLHLDSKFRQIIMTRSAPDNGWIEIGRARCPALTDDAWHTAVLTMTGPDITLLLDGAEVYKGRDTALAAGRFGLGTSEGQVTYHNLRIEGTEVAMAQSLALETPDYQIISKGGIAGPYQAFPDACRLQDGGLMAVFYDGYGHVSLPNEEWRKGGRVNYVVSKDEGRTWTEPRVLYDDRHDNRDPHIAQLRDGTLLCSFFNYWSEAGPTRFHCMITRSTNGGRTWRTAAQQVSPDGWACSAPVRELPDGTLLLGVYTEGAGGSWGGVVRSTDGGQTWSEPIPIGQEAKLPLDAETDVIRLKDGTLYAALRSSSINMHYATSRDQGLTWSPVKDIGFPGHAPHFTRLHTGEVLLTHRVPQTALHVSRDDCRTWQGPHILDNVGGAYPATVELRDGTVLAIYYEEGGGSSVRATRFRLKPDGIQRLRFQ